MSLYNEPLVEILDAVNAKNTLALVQDEYTYGPATVVTPAVGGNDNTSMLITSKGDSSAYDGEVAVRYHRRDLADLGELVSLNITAYEVSTLLGVAQRLNTLYGTNFTADDIIDGPANLVNGEGTVTLVAKATSRGWIGEVDVNLSFGDRPLKDFLTVTMLPGLNYPENTLEKPYASVYSYWRDFSEWRDTLLQVSLGTDTVPYILDVLKEATGDNWIDSDAGRYSLKGATVSYVGLTDEEPLANTDYDQVVIVDMDPNNSTALVGRLVLHFYMPVVEEVENGG